MTPVAIYRKVDKRLWNDLRFRALSERAKLLWLYLLTCPETLPIPGVIVTGYYGLIESLNWTEDVASRPLVEVFGERYGIPYGIPFQEGIGNHLDTVSRGLSKHLAIADWKAKLVWLPNATKYNRPDNPNVVKSWGKHWDSVPECGLKRLIWHELKAFSKGLGKPYLERFAEGLPEPYAIPFAEPTSNGIGNQEQEQEQEQERGSIPENGFPAAVAGDEKAARRPRKETASVEIPESLQTADFLAAWTDWLAFRREERHTTKPKYLAGKLAELELLGASIASETLRYSTSNRYQGLFPERFTTKRPNLDRAAQQEARIIQQVQDSMEMP